MIKSNHDHRLSYKLSWTHARSRGIVQTCSDTTKLLEFEKDVLDQMPFLVMPPIYEPRISLVWFQGDAETALWLVICHSTNRLYTVCLGSYHSDRSRHVAPLQEIHRTPLSNSRAFRLGRPMWGSCFAQSMRINVPIPRLSDHIVEWFCSYDHPVWFDMWCHVSLSVFCAFLFWLFLLFIHFRTPLIL